LFKVAIQAYGYATLLRWLVVTAVHKKLISRKLTLNDSGQTLWQRSFVVVYIGLFLFSLTYWGDHGLGDSARLPIGHGEAIAEINGMAAYFEAAAPITLPTDAPLVDKFRVADDVLCGQAGNTYFTYNLATKQQKLFASSEEYNAHARQHSLPNASELQSFGEVYAQYWGGWRFWLLA
jgi:hypothetical protein